MDEFRSTMTRIGEHARTAGPKIDALRRATAEALDAYEAYLRRLEEDPR